MAPPARSPPGECSPALDLARPPRAAAGTAGTEHSVNQKKARQKVGQSSQAKSRQLCGPHLAQRAEEGHHGPPWATGCLVQHGASPRKCRLVRSSCCEGFFFICPNLACMSISNSAMRSPVMGRGGNCACLSKELPIPSSVEGWLDCRADQAHVQGFRDAMQETLHSARLPNHPWAVLGCTRISVPTMGLIVVLTMLRLVEVAFEANALCRRLSRRLDSDFLPSFCPSFLASFQRVGDPLRVGPSSTVGSRYGLFF